MPNFYILAGPNGAGKTTAAYTLLPEVLDVRNFVNADEIARGLSPFDVESVAFEAGRIMLQRIDYLLNAGADFAVLSTSARLCVRGSESLRLLARSASSLLRVSGDETAKRRRGRPSTEVPISKTRTRSFAAAAIASRAFSCSRNVECVSPAS